MRPFVSQRIRRLLYRACNKGLAVHVYHVQQRDHAREDDDPRRYDGFVFRALTASEVRGFADDPLHDLPAAMASRIGSGRDFCFAALQSGRLASYVWCALNWIEPEHCGNAGMSLPADVAYIYKAYTTHEFRGRQLYGATLRAASASLARLGITRLTCLVEWTNQASLRSHQRLGFLEVGSLFTVGRGKQRLFRAPRRAAELGLAFGTKITQQEVLQNCVC